MKSCVRTLAVASCLLLSLTACGKQYVKRTPPERCPPIPEDVDSAVDGVLKDTLGWLIDEYTRCAAKVDSLHD